MKKLRYFLMLLPCLMVLEGYSQCTIGDCVGIDCGNLNASFMSDGGPDFCDGEVITLNNTSDAGFDYFVVDWGNGAIDTLYDYSAFSHVFTVPEEDLCQGSSYVVYSICFIGYKFCDAGISCQSGTLAFAIRKRPVAFFQLPNSTPPGEAFLLEDFSCNAESYTIDYGDGTTSTDINATHTYDEEGVYEVQVEVLNDCGIDTYMQSVEVIQENAFDFDITVTGATTESQNDTIIIFNVPGTPLVFSAMVEGAITSGWSVDVLNLGVDYTTDELNLNAAITGEGFLTLSLTITTAEGTATVTQAFEVRNLLVNMPPTFVVPPSVDVICGDSTEPAATGEPTQVEDDTDPDPVISHTDELVATDCPNRFFIERIWRVTDSDGLFSENFQIISVTDDSPPSFSIPAIVEFTNGEDINDFSLTGEPTDLSDNCTAAEDLEIVFVGDEYTIEPGEDCLFSFVRTWQVIDECGNMTTKTQQITVNDPFSVDVTITDPPECPNDLMTTLTLNIMSGAAYTVNWNDENYDGLDTLNNIGVGTYSVTVTNDYGCTSSISHTLTATDTEAPVFQSCPSDTTILLSGNSTAALVSWDLPQIVDDCSATTNMILQNNGYSNAMGVFPLGEREVYYLAVDEAGNESDTCRFTVSVEVFDELNFYYDDNDWELLGNRLRMPVKVTDFNEILAYQMTVQLSPAAAVDSLIITTLADQEEINWEAYSNGNVGLLWLSESGEARSLPDSSILFYLDVYVNSNLTDCLFFEWTENFVPSLIVRSNGTEAAPELQTGEFCGTPNLAVGGRITSRIIEPLANVEVILADESVLSNANGLYRFEEVGWNSDGIISPAYDEDPLNGVNVVDFVLIRNHILRTQVFVDPYSFIAGDTDGSKRVSLLDLVAIQRLLLGQNDDFPALPSWQFIPNELPLVLSQDLDSVPGYTSSIAFEALSQELLNQDFTGVKTGDINASANAINEVNEGVSPLSVTVLIDEIPKDESVQSLYFVQNEQQTVAAYQLSLTIEHPSSWKLLNDKVRLPADCYYSYNAKTGELRLFYGRQQANYQAASWPRFVFQSVEEKKGDTPRLSFQPGTAITALAADEEAHLRPILLERKLLSVISTPFVSFAEQGITAHFSPNPFSNELNISGSLAQESLVHLTMYSSTGQQVYTSQKEIPAGEFDWQIADMENLSAGIYFVRLQGEAFDIIHKIMKQ